MSTLSSGALIRRALAGTGPVPDPVAVALARLPAGQARTLYPDPLIPAAVLVPLVEREAGISVLLTRRADHLRDHPGQISFPGGRMEAGDRSPVDTALREAREEIGIEPASLEVVGCLPPHAVVTGFVVSPVVGFLPAAAVLQPDPLEVAEVFEVPLAHFLDPGTMAVGQREVRGLRLTVYSWDYGRHRIWGATAQMIRTLCEIVYGTVG